MKKKLYKDSPLNALGQGINDLLNYQDLKQASGQFDPVGETLFSLGEMFASKSWSGKEDKKPSDGAVEEALNQFTDSLPDVGDGIVDVEDVEVDMSYDWDIEDDLDNIGKIVPVKEEVVIEEPVDQKLIKDPKREENAFYIGKDAFNQGGTGLKDAKITGNPDPSVQSSTPGNEILSDQAIEENKSAVQKGLSPKQLGDVETKTNQIFGGSRITPNVKGSVGKRLKGGSPLDRMNPEKLKALKGLMYNTSNGDSPLRRIAHMMNSPFLKTDEGPNLEKVDFRYMKRATSTGIGSLGGAASAGYNLVIDAKNYETAVQKDYDEELSEGMGDLVMELKTTNPNYEHDMFELANGKKKEYADGFAAYAAGDIDRLTWENKKMKLKGDLENHGKALNIIAQTDKSFAEGKGSAFNTKASNEKLTDYYNTRMKNPDAFTVKNIDGVDTYVGETLQGKEVRLPISMIASGAARMQLVPQYDINKAVNQGLKVMKAFTVEGKTALGYGSRNLNQNNPEEAARLREMAVDAIKREIGADETRLRSILADERQLGFNEVEQLLDTEGGSRNENLQGLLQQMSEEIYDERILNQGGYQAESKTSFRSLQPKQTKGSAKERTSAQIAKELDALGNIDNNNYKQFESQISKSNFEKGYRIVPFKDGLKIVKYNLKTLDAEFARPYNKKTMLELAGAQAGTKLPILNKQ
jgi:hypothetical protein